ncbi:MAG: FMN-binding glutamate synthase family protein, partial [Oleibacter sp.]|nr:FMN-binding glutamate synthase family protein [Thalassolituus sp.]
MTDQIFIIAAYGMIVLLSLLAIITLSVFGWVAFAYFIDIRQTSHTVRRNFPVIGRFRYFFEHLGEFFRQYFFAMDREEMPFNRAERSWVYRAAKKVNTTISFGSTRHLDLPGTVIFVNSPFPALKTEFAETQPITVGEHCRTPYTTSSLINVSGMSFGALSQPAVQALSRGAKKAGIWMNTGEGGLSPYHLEGGCDIVFQIGTAKYGVRNELGELDDDKLHAIAAHEQVRMFEIKL